MSGKRESYSEVNKKPEKVWQSPIPSHQPTFTHLIESQQYLSLYHYLSFQWMTIVQFVWPCLVFLLLYTIRLKFNAVEKPDCQFPTRQLPTKRQVLPFFHSYICSIENKCLDAKDYEEYSNYESAPLRPILDVAQIIIGEDNLYTALVDLPTKVNFVGAIMTLVTSSHFDVIRQNIEKVLGLVPLVEEMIGGSFDIKKLFSGGYFFLLKHKLY